jgi:Methyltransferase FkbM domain
VDVCGSLVDGRAGTSTEGLETVQGVLLSEYIDGEIDFLKMDIEGAEVNVLREVAAAGKLELIRRLVIEYHHHIDPMADRLSEVLGLLERHGFSYQLKAKRLHVENPGAFQDIIIACTRRDLMTRTGQLT